MRTRLAHKPLRRSRLVSGVVPVLLVLGLSFVAWIGTELGAVASKEPPGKVRMPVNHVFLESEADAAPDGRAESAEAPLEVDDVPGVAADRATAQGDDSQAADTEQSAEAAKGDQAPDAADHGRTITGVRLVKADDDGATLSARLQGKAGRTTWFYLPDPGRLIIDIHGPRETVGPAVYRFDSGPVKHVVIGEHPDRLRLAVVLRSPVPEAVRPVLSPSEEGLSISISAP